jgi:hypothetical protein
LFAQVAVPAVGRSLSLLGGSRYMPDVPSGMFNAIEWYMKVIWFHLIFVFLGFELLLLLLNVVL